MTTEFAPQDPDPTVRCNNCGTSLAPDQRYCVNCGERRGSTRFSSAMFAAADAPAPAPSAPTRSGGPSRLFSGSGFTLVAFVATLLVAVGLGVLIGHDSSTNTPQRVAASQPPVNVTVNGGGSGAAGTSASTGSGSTSSATKSKSGKVKTKKVTAKVAAKAAAKGTAAANKSLGGGGSNLAPPTAKTGSKCSKGAGCSGGKFTGNFFGGG
jgi:cytoskeletal protein RodZ